MHRAEADVWKMELSQHVGSRCSAWSPCFDRAFKRPVIKCKKQIRRRAVGLLLLGCKGLLWKAACLILSVGVSCPQSRSNSFNICRGGNRGAGFHAGGGQGTDVS